MDTAYVVADEHSSRAFTVRSLIVLTSELLDRGDWWPDLTREHVDAMSALESALINGEPAAQWEAYLGVTVRPLARDGGAV